AGAAHTRSARPHSRTSVADAAPQASSPACSSPPRVLDLAVVPNFAVPPTFRDRHRIAKLRCIYTDEDFFIIRHDSSSLREALPGLSGQPSLAHRGRVASIWEGHTVFAHPGYEARRTYSPASIHSAAPRHSVSRCSGLKNP